MFIIYSVFIVVQPVKKVSANMSLLYSLSALMECWTGHQMNLRAHVLFAFANASGPLSFGQISSRTGPDRANHNRLFN